ncbi:monosaccharide ABC transporter substrate-binding protein, CUT2 family [Palleronia marisminoris]|uniref:D-ribose transporter subunit RbsB n=1 Tax=Palleronia marisminoris TaxID=315423 RepID=A0A1Y5RM05_9RHOB|nr:substrate-binding domain-containing protein [Palleronia marisminoris]SFG26834.1 monosaccharide ABC transporter substrate-binding protein, CUT2 family [Palleronia marisminoris]SLN20468.1 D-ribose transporter subunit RbsB [Palleronia marisminoris]
MKRILMATGAFAVSVVPLHAQNFDDPQEFAKQQEQLQAEPMGPEGQPWLQHIGGEMTETADLGLEAPATVCFSNAGVNNPWRVVGYTNMMQEVANHESIGDFVHVDAEGSDDKQIADINDLLAGGDCDVMIVSPNTTAALTPAVERACEDMPVIVFDRGVNTDCPVTFVHPIGGYGFGIQGAEFIVENVDEGSNVLMLRILPGVDVLETRYSAGRRILDEAGMNIVGAEFTDGDNAKTKSIVEDYLMRGDIDAVWMDAGATAVAAIEAFEDSGYEIPVFVGEDQQDFLRKWQDEDLTAIAPTYPTFQWRTAVIAAARVIEGEPVPAPEWVLPQPAITQDELADYVNPAMPPLHYAMCGCESMENYPDAWGGN